MTYNVIEELAEMSSTDSITLCYFFLLLNIVIIVF